MSVVSQNYSTWREEQNCCAPSLGDFSSYSSSFDDMLLSQSRPGSENSFISSNYDSMLETNQDEYRDLCSPTLGNELDLFPDTGARSSWDLLPQGNNSAVTLTNLDKPGSYVYDVNWHAPEQSAAQWQSQYPSFASDVSTENFDLDTFPEIETTGFGLDFDVDIPFVDSPSSGSDSGSSSFSLQSPFPEIKTEEILTFPGDASQECSGMNSTTNTKANANANKIRRRHGRQPTLWQFLYHALDHPDDYNHMISWVDLSKGIFEFSSKNKDDLARAWGAVKNNRCPMTYPKLARALRKYIEMEKFVTKYKRKLQYVFRPEFLQQLQSNVSLRKLSASDEKKMYEFSRSQQIRG